jgi:hypothetical protein
MIFLAKLGVGVMGTALVAGAALSSEGFIHVKVQERQPGGTNINLVVPAALVPATLSLVPGNDLADASEEIRPYLPIIDAAIPALEESPDGVIVEVIDAQDHVVVAKTGGSMVVDVRDAADTVHVSVPLGAARRAIHEIAEARGGN